MTTSRLTRVLAAAAAASTLASCGGGDLLDDAGDRERHGAAHQKVKKQERRESDRRDKSTKQQGTQEKGSAPGSGGGAAGGAGESVATSTGQAPSGPETGPAPGPSKPASSCTADVAGDMESAGSPPSYADLTNGCIREQGDGIVLDATTAGTLPARMPDQSSNLAVAFSIDPPSGPTTYVTAEVTGDGWTAYLNRGDDRRELPAPAISGNQLRLALPASELGGARRLQWSVQSSWLRSTLTSTAYAFDDAPNGASSSFDRG